ncbi:MAG: hypothetical protein AB7E61_07175 [Acholeplasmataceae bacterium]
MNYKIFDFVYHEKYGKGVVTQVVDTEHVNVHFDGYAQVLNVSEIQHAVILNQYTCNKMQAKNLIKAIKKVSRSVRFGEIFTINFHVSQKVSDPKEGE